MSATSQTVAFRPSNGSPYRPLVSDGGTLSSGDIADTTGRHVDSVRRALDRLGDMVEKEYGRVSLRSNHIADLVHDAVKEAKESTRRPSKPERKPSKHPDAVWMKRPAH